MIHQHAHAPRLPLNGIRIAGTSAAIALHALVLMLLFTPATWAPPKVEVQESTPLVPDVPVTRIVDVIPPPKPKTDQQKPATAVPTRFALCAAVAPLARDRSAWS